MAELLHITGRCDWEYPHVYGPIPVSSVTEVIDVGRDATGRLIVPEDR